MVPMICELKEMDVLEGLRSLRKFTAHVVVTSPPYNRKKKYGSSRDNLKRQDYLDWTLAWCSEVHRVLFPEGSFFLNIGCNSKWPTQAHDVVSLLTGPRGEKPPLFRLQNTFHWIKSITIGEESHGHFTPINSPRYVNDLHEFVFHLTKNGEVPLDRMALGVPYQDKSNIRRWGHTGGNDLRCRGNVWFIPYRTIQRQSRDRPHPATFPPQLAANCIQIHKGQHLTVLDPFVGLGNALIGARDTEKVHRFIGIDHDPFYIEETRSKI